MIVTKQNILDFLDSLYKKESSWEIKKRDTKLSNSLSELHSILDPYWLWNKPNSYVLNEHEVHEIMYMGQPDTHAYKWFQFKGITEGGVDLYDLYMDWYKVENRDEIINSVIV